MRTQYLVWVLPGAAVEKRPKQDVEDALAVYDEQLLAEDKPPAEHDPYK